MNYDFEIKKIKKEIKRRKAKKILLQFPEGLKTEAKKVMDELKEYNVFLSADPCFGACDIKTKGFDLTIHFAHSKMLPSKKVIYIETRSNLDVKKVVKKALKELGKKVTVVTTVQHIHKLKEAEELLKKAGKKVIPAKKGKRATYKGQVLGCDASAALTNADSILYLGSGYFHPLFISFITKKKVVQANPYSNKIEVMKPIQWEKEKYLRISKAMKAKNFAWVFSTKPGQKLFPQNKVPKKDYKIVMENISPDSLDYLPFDAFVITACPRIVYDDWKNYKKPILLPNEYKELKKIKQR